MSNGFKNRSTEEIRTHLVELGVKVPGQVPVKASKPEDQDHHSAVASWCPKIWMNKEPLKDLLLSLAEGSPHAMISNTLGLPLKDVQTVASYYAEALTLIKGMATATARTTLAEYYVHKIFEAKRNYNPDVLGAKA